MNEGISKSDKISYHNVFPKNRDFFLLDNSDNIKQFETTNDKDPEYIYVIYLDIKQNIHEKIYKRNLFLNDYEFIKVSTSNPDIYLNFLIRKEDFNNERENKLYTLIKLRKPYFKEISRKTNINFRSKKKIQFKEVTSSSNEPKLYNRIFQLCVGNQNFQKESNTQNQIDKNLNNIDNINNNNNFNHNNINSGNDNNLPNNFNNNINDNTYQHQQIFQDNNIVFNNFNNDGDINKNSKTQMMIIENYFNNNQNMNNINKNSDYKEYIEINKVDEIDQKKGNMENQSNQCNNIQKPNTNITFSSNPSKNLNNNISFDQRTKSEIQNYNNIKGNNQQINQINFKDNKVNKDGKIQMLDESKKIPSQQGKNNGHPDQNPSQKASSQPKQNPDQSKQYPPQIENKLPEPEPIISKKLFIFPTKGLRNIGSTCYMNATLQCLLHVSELSCYFIDEYPRDRSNLLAINKNVQSGGEISRVFYELVIGVIENATVMTKSKLLNPKTKKKNIFDKIGDFMFGNFDNYKNAFSPDEFKRILGLHNPQFRKFEANDSKDLILYLLQTLHEEMNYFGNQNKRLNFLPNQYDMFNTYQYFLTNYNSNNFSKISILFYGTYINITTCNKCNYKLYNFQKFEFISFGMFYYHNKKFNIMDGFRDNSRVGYLTGDNKFLCNICNSFQDAETTTNIFEPPCKLLINLDYGKNKKYQPSSIYFDEEIDITQFIPFDYKMRIRYRILGVCTHYGLSGSYGHYVAFCKNRENNVWYEFNDSSCNICNKKDIYRGSPYLLLYERIF